MDLESLNPVADLPTDPLAPERIRVVLVEDHGDLRDQLTAVLRDADIDVVGAGATASQGLAAVLAHRPEIAVIDNRLPDGSGVELCRRIRQQAPEVVLLLHTGALESQEYNRALEAGVAAVVPKTITSGMLLDAIVRYRPPSPLPG